MLLKLPSARDTVFRLNGSRSPGRQLVWCRASLLDKNTYNFDCTQLLKGLKIAMVGLLQPIELVDVIGPCPRPRESFYKLVVENEAYYVNQYQLI